MSFAEFGLADTLVRAIADQGYSTPTPIQSRTIPLILAGRDLLAAAQTGTGKTAAFALPLLHRLHTRRAPGRAQSKGRAVRALVLTPTRELAAQVGDSVRAYGRYAALRSAVIIGGVKMKPQLEALQQGVDILIATPGRLLDHVQQKSVDLARIEMLVLDEADRMLDMGFLPAIQRLLALLPKQRQNLLFSATLPEAIRTLARTLLNQPVAIDVAPRNAPAAPVSQHIHRVERGQKLALLIHLLKAGNATQTLVFTRTKHAANRLAQQLERQGINAAALHGNKSQGARTRALTGFKAGQVRVLVATDIAARGLDIDQLPLVVNYELPAAPEDYIHRIGRTGRAGHAGMALSFVGSDEAPALNAIQRLLGQALPVRVVEGFAPAEAHLPHARAAQEDRRPPPPHRPRARPGAAPRSAPQSRPRRSP